MAIVRRSNTTLPIRLSSLVALLMVCLSWQFAVAPKANAFALRNGDVGWDGPGLNAVTLLYDLAQGTADLSNELGIIQSALDEWNNYVKITFKLEGPAGRPDQLDFYFTNIDPSTGLAWAADTLARGFYPDDVNPNPLAGDIYFNDLLTWTGGTAADGTCNTASANQALNTCDFYFVALHEIGHALGLGHPLGDATPTDCHNLPAGAVMSPCFNPVGNPDPANPGFGNFAVLQADDIAGIRAIYATGQGAMVVPEPSTLTMFSVALLVFLRAGYKPKRKSDRAARASQTRETAQQ